ncbi:acetyl-CoA synthetase-like protein [Schizopora paradoxa]|uniref:Acetyl-CoA synthetase-like protein n=1 Tax=Schizopora paradoxa TaxID=27342 RepID=A0A0H2RPG6_9AGAM|nr:acetyl-CoA synthetase-like protein [Schizopora paradoxa]
MVPQTANLEAKLLLPPTPRTQALSSATFKAPPLDGSLSISEIYDWHGENSKEHPLFVYSDASGNLRTIQWFEAVRAIHRAGRLVKSRVSDDDGGEGTVIAILANADTITFFTFIMGIVRAGYVAFPISTRNSAAAIEHLLNKIQVTHMLVGREHALQSLASDSLESVSNKPKVSTMPCFEDIYSSSEPPFTLPPNKVDFEKPAIILHSSGSTAFPRPIVWKQSYMLQLSLSPLFGQRDLTGVRFGCHSIPMFHAMGALQITWAASCGHVVGSFEPQSPAVVPTPEAVIKGARDTKCNFIYCVPSFVEHWSRNPECVAHLQTIDGVMFGGGPLNKVVGDDLTRKGVTLFVLYGSTECGAHNMVLPREVDNDWDYFYVPEHINASYIPNEIGNVEFVIASNSFLTPCIFNTKVDNADAYAVGDFLTPHPSKPGFFRYFGRADDQIIHSTGEKTNPGPLGNILNQSPLVQMTVMFGEGKFHAGVLIDPKPEYKINQTNVEELVLFRQRIWYFIEKLNEHAPQHSRVFKEMIIVSKPSKPFTYTAKSSARRQAIIKEYAAEIEELYASVDESTQSDLVPPDDWVLNNVLPFVRKIILDVIHRSISDEDDIFQHGCDSLQATWIRNTLMSGLTRSDKQVSNIPMNFVYENPSIAGLASFISQIAGSTADGSAVCSPSTISKEVEMANMVAKYSSDFPQHHPVFDNVRGSEAHVVILTGSTGGLGCVLLEKLLSCVQVSMVYALNRPSSKNLRARQESVLQERGIDVSIINSPKLILLECNVNEPQFGLSTDLFNEMQKTVTHIVHNAYNVNFNMALSTFESNVSGLRKLMDFALASPRQETPRFIFTSSVGIVHNCAEQPPVSETLVDASSAVWSGYSESKWVCEQILANAASETSLKPIIIRVDQLSGMSTNGFWTVRDWVPAIFTSSVHVGSLPGTDGTVSWIPIDTAAQAVVEMRDAEYQVLHISHPNPTKWSTIVKHASQLLDIPTVSFDDWLSNLDTVPCPASAACAEDLEQMSTKNPALQLRGFLQSLAPSSDPAAESDPVEEAFGAKRLSLEKSAMASPTLRNRCPPLSFSDVRNWLLCLGLKVQTS